MRPSNVAQPPAAAPTAGSAGGVSSPPAARGNGFGSPASSSDLAPQQPAAVEVLRQHQLKMAQMGPAVTASLLGSPNVSTANFQALAQQQAAAVEAPREHQLNIAQMVPAVTASLLGSPNAAAASGATATPSATAANRVQAAFAPNLFGSVGVGETAIGARAGSFAESVPSANAIALAAGKERTLQEQERTKQLQMTLDTLEGTVEILSPRNMRNEADEPDDDDDDNRSSQT